MATELTVADEVFHAPADDEHWCESGWFGWPGRLTFWTLTDWQWDGIQGYGEDQEFFARAQVRALIKRETEFQQRKCEMAPAGIPFRGRCGRSLHERTECRADIP